MNKSVKSNRKNASPQFAPRRQVPRKAQSDLEKVRRQLGWDLLKIGRKG